MERGQYSAPVKYIVLCFILTLFSVHPINTVIIAVDARPEAQGDIRPAAIGGCGGSSGEDGGSNGMKLGKSWVSFTFSKCK